MDANLFQELTQSGDFTPSTKERVTSGNRGLPALIENFRDKCRSFFIRLNFTQKLVLIIIPFILLSTGGIIIITSNKTGVKKTDKIPAIIPNSPSQNKDAVYPSDSPALFTEISPGNTEKPPETDKDIQETDDTYTGNPVSLKSKTEKTKTTVGPFPKSNDSPGSANTGTSKTSTGGPNNSSGGDSGNQTTPDQKTDDWKIISNPTFGYTLKYPYDWFVKKIGFIGSAQATSFSTISNPNEIIATFYIKTTKSDTGPFLDAGYKTSTYTTKDGTTYVYQCVHKLDENIRKSCDTMVSLITFDN